jgi:hypothetical protein
METKNPSVDLQNASGARDKRITKLEVKEALIELAWTGLGYSICAVALLSIGFRLGVLLMTE